MIVRIEKMVYGGGGLGKSLDGHGSDALVPFCLPGEVMDVVPSPPSGDARAAEVLEPSGDRRAPGCIHFGECGGCQYQHAIYPAQLAIKRSILADVMGSAGVSGLPEIQMHSGPEWAYRNRIRLRVEQVEGDLRVGYSRRGSNTFLPIEECPIAAPVLWRAASALVELATADGTARRWLAAASEVEIFATPDESRVQLSFSLREVEPLRSAGALVRGSAGSFKAFCESLAMRLPELVGAGAEMDAELGRRARRNWKPVSWGAEGLAYRTAGEQYWVSRGAFFQVNRFLLDELVELAAGGRAGGLAWDLYAGVGLFSRALAAGFTTLVAVEAGAPAGEDLEHMLAKLGTDHRAVRATTVEFLRAAVLQRELPDLIVMDPPRAGVGPEVCSLLIRLGSPAIVYVSCDPVTLARDLRLLCQGGYVVRGMHLVDLFPQTFHMETVVVLGRDTN